MKKTKFYFGIMFVLLLCIDQAFALLISEIHPSKSAGKEWIEIYNNSNESYNLTDHKFFEDNVRRSLSTTTLATSFILNSGEYALLVDDVNKFLTEYKNYTGKVFRTTSFDLDDDSELLELRTSLSNWTTLDGICYKKENITLEKSLTFTGTDFQITEETPGTGNLALNASSIYVTGACAGSVPNSTDTTSTSTTSTTSETTITTFTSPTYFYRSYWPESEKIYVDAGRNKVSFVGSDVFFEAKAVNGDKKIINNANFFWSFGDGDSKEGNKTFHVYKYPGEYTVDLEGYASGYTNSARIYVKVIEPEVKIKLKENKTKDPINSTLVEITNLNKDEIDIGGFLVKTSGGEFESTKTLPKILSILPGKSIVLSQETLKSATNTSKVELLFTNGKVLSSFENKEKKFTFKNSQPAISTSSVVVYTKEDFEKNKILGKIQNQNPKTSAITRPLAVKKSSPVKYFPATNSTTSLVQSSETGKFIIKNESEPLFQKFFKYFGI